MATYRPDYLLVLLGLNDLFWYSLSQPAMANNLASEIKIAAAFADVLASRFHLGQPYPKPYPLLPTGPLIHPRLTVRPSSKARRAVLTWTLAPGASSYSIYIKDVTRLGAGFTRLPYPLPVSKDPWTAGLLSSGDTYTFRVQACKGLIAACSRTRQA